MIETSDYTLGFQRLVCLTHESRVGQPTENRDLMGSPLKSSVVTVHLAGVAAL